MKKRIWAVILMVCMMLSFFPPTVIVADVPESDLVFSGGKETVTEYAGEDTEGSSAMDGEAAADEKSVICETTVKAMASQADFEFQADEQWGMIITKYIGEGGDVEIPAVIDGIGVTLIGASAFKDCSGVTSVTIPNSVTYIDNSAFMNCSGLTSIIIPDGVTAIGMLAFYGCSGLKSINIPDSVTSIGNKVFYKCRELANVVIPDGVTSIGEQTFYQSGITSITIPDSVTNIGKGAFCGCSKLTSVRIPDGVMSIEEQTFSGCSSLTNVTIPDSVTSIGREAFNYCSSLISVRIPDGVTSIENSTFYECTSLASVTIPDSVTSIGQGAFCGCSGLTDIRIPDGVMNIGAAAFGRCSSLKSIAIPDGVTSIGNDTFANCWGLTSITIPDSITSIEQGAFYGCSSLKNITISDSVTSIGNSVFENCSSLERIDYGGTEEQWAGIAQNSGVPSQTVVYCNVRVESISINPDSLSLGVGETIALTATLTPDNATHKAVTWTSSDTKVAKVDANGIVTAVGIGKVTIRATTDGNRKNASCMVTVIAATDVIPVTDVKLDATSATIVKGGTKQLTATVTPGNATNQTVTWRSLNPSVATVSGSGLVTAKEAGVAMITVSTEDGSRSATCEVTVTDVTDVIPVTSVSLNTTSATIVKGGTKQLTATVMPGNATNQAVVWSSSNMSVATVSVGGLVTAKEAGTAIIRVTVDGKSATCKITVQPVKPLSVKAVSAGYSSIKVSWKKVSGASGYEIYRATSKNGKYSKIGTVARGSIVTHTDKKAVTGTRYYYKVRAYTISGKSKIYSGYGAVVNAKAALASPVVTVKRASSTSAKISWKKVSGANGYRVQMSTKKNSGFKTKATIKKGSTVSSTVKNLKKGKKYYFRVQVYRTVNGRKVYSGWSAVKSITIQ